MSKSEKIAQLEESLRTYEEVIASFERARERMLQRRRGAIDSVMVHLDESLALNHRTLESLKRVRSLACEQLKELRSERESSAT